MTRATRRRTARLLRAVCGAILFSLLGPALADAEDYPLRDYILGERDAPVTVIAYLSFGCAHCTGFQSDDFPVLAKLINLGLVRLAVRDFPLSSKFMAAHMLARCAAGANAERYYSIVDVLNSPGARWLSQSISMDELNPELLRIAAANGLDLNGYRSCAAQLLEPMRAAKEFSRRSFGVEGVPALFINGVKYQGYMTPDELRNAVTAADPVPTSEHESAHAGEQVPVLVHPSNAAETLGLSLEQILGAGAKLPPSKPAPADRARE